jgi:two-component system, OmpR family, sensor histidine kinase QseC
MNSLKGRLFAILVVATSIIWLAAICWIYVETRREIESVLDARLQEAALMASSLVPTATAPAQSPPVQLHASELNANEHQISCQIWSLDGRLVARSSGAPDEKLSDMPAGFSERLIDGETWRVYTLEDITKGVRVLVGDRLGLREHLVTDIIKGLVAPTLLILPLLGFLIWASLHRGLTPLRRIAGELKERDADDMSAIAMGQVPTEIQPLVVALNGLFTKVQAARLHEREITAFAAHELRTPLAGLRTQAQISIATNDRATRDTALRQIVVSVDRTTRLVRQLLAISKLDATHGLSGEADVNVGDVIGEVVESVPLGNKTIQVLIDPVLSRTSIVTNRELLTLTLRNLQENAVGHMRDDGLVRWLVERRQNEIVVAIEDEGPGIPEEELHQVTNRFFRGRHKSVFGSGLGLAIVQVALRTIGANLRFINRKNTRGLRVEVSWPIETDGGSHQEATESGRSKKRRGALRLIQAQ